MLGIRPEDIHDEQEPIFFETYPNAQIVAKADMAELLGAETNIYTTISEANVIAAVPSRDDITFDSKVKLVFDMNKAHFFDAETEENISFMKHNK